MATISPGCFEVKFVGMVPITASNIPAKFHSNNQKIFEEKCKNVISDPKNGHPLPRSRSFEVKSSDKVRASYQQQCPYQVSLE